MLQNQVPLPISFVAFDLETTGLNPAEHKIIEIGAVKVVDGKIVDGFDRLIDPMTDIPYHITQLTGITYDDVHGAELATDVLPQFMEFVGDLPLVAHNAPFDANFLESAYKSFDRTFSLTNKVYDTFELARIFVPQMRFHKLSTLLAYFKIELEDAHRAFDDAQGAAYLLLSIFNVLASFELETFDILNTLLDQQDWPFTDLLETARQHSTKYALSRKIGRETFDQSELILADNVLGEAGCLPVERPQPLDPEEVKTTLNRLQGGLQKYEDRPQQREMSMLVSQAFRDNQYLVVEAGTGTGKSIAYLIPAILHSLHYGERIVISTNTKNLQEQLFYHDIPLLQKMLGLDFKAVLLKGRGNYLCRRRWKEVMGNPEIELTPEERLDILPLITWVQDTNSGDVAECNGFRVHQNQTLWSKINADQNNCSTQDCKNFKNGTCFLYNIRNQSSNAHLVVINHSLLFSDISTENSVLDEYHRLVIDEAHNLERVATEYLGTTLMVWDFRTVTQRMYAKSNRGETGELIKLRRKVSGASADIAWKNRMQDHILEAITASQILWEQTQNYFRYLTDFSRNLNNSKFYKGALKMRLKPHNAIYQEFGDQSQDLKVLISELRRQLERLKDGLEDVDKNQIESYDTLITDLSGRLSDTQSLLDTIDFFMEPDIENHVFWLEGPRRSDSFDTRWRSAPLSVAELLKEKLYDHLQTIVLTSATVAVNRTFNFFNERVGLALVNEERLVTRQVGSPFNFDEQALILVPTYLPDPKSQAYTEQVANMLKNVSFLTRRGTLVLFTSYGMLNKTYQMVKDDFESRKIMLMGQGQDGSRSNILNRFKDEDTSVLFGTDSFWEGVDVPGQSLEILIITRLPFMVPDEPLVEAHQEVLQKKGLSPFEHYMVPKAVLKFRQGFGRLIRRRDDIGMVIITDTRVARTRYGATFLNSLPTGARRIQSERDLLLAARNFFSKK